MNGKLCLCCKTEVSVNYNKYCPRCLRIKAGRSPEPKFKRDSSNTDKCCKCKVNPRLSYHRYCHECKKVSLKAWVKSKGGDWAAKTPEQKRRAVVRRYMHTQIQSGKIQKQDCKVCGSVAEMHHLDYESKTTNVIWLCKEHHVVAEQQKKNGLTNEQVIDYLFK